MNYSNQTLHSGQAANRPTNNRPTISLESPLQLYQLPLTKKHYRVDEDNELLIKAIYSKYDFKFGCHLKQLKGLKLLAYAKPLIQYFIDKLIVELRILNQKGILEHGKMESVVNAFTPMYLNRLARVSDKLVETDPKVSEFRKVSDSNLGGQVYEPFVTQIQNKEFVEYLQSQYPDLFLSLIQVSNNWLAFVIEFSSRKKAIVQTFN